MAAAAGGGRQRSSTTSQGCQPTPAARDAERPRGARVTIVASVGTGMRMATTDPRVDAYINKAPEFARPVLKNLRAAVHAACPEVEEALKWGHPHFLYRGMLCGMAAFKQHCAFGFWKGRLVVDEATRKAEGGMGHFGRLTSVADLPTRRALGALV